MSFNRKMNAKEVQLFGATNLPNDGLLHLSELFRGIQGEGLLIGAPSIFLRLAYCNQHCSWCDTDWSRNFVLTPYQAALKLLEMTGTDRAVDNVVLTGGEPCLQADRLVELIGHVHDLKKGGRPFIAWNIETNGTILHGELYDKMTGIVISPKPLSSGCGYKSWSQLWDFLKMHGRWTRTQIKCVVDTHSDLAYYRAIAMSTQRIPEVPFIFQLATNPEDDSLDDFRLRHKDLLTPEFIDWLAKFNARVLPRFHVLVWGNEAGR